MKKSFLLTRSDAGELAGEFEEPCLVLSRSELVYCCLDVANIPPARRAQFIGRQSAKYSPFKDSGYFFHESGGKAQLWLWDADWERERRAGLPAKAARLKALPEPLFHPALASGYQLVVCEKGFDLQHWQDSVLLASRYYRAAPDDTEQLRFFQGCNTGAPETLPEQPLHWLPLPWSHRPSSWRDLLREERVLYPAIAASLAFFLFVQLGVSMTLGLRESMAERRIEGLRAGLVARLEMQQQAELLRIVNSEWRGHVGAPSQLELIAEVTSKLGFAEYQLAEWDYNNGSLRMVISDPNASTREYVTRLAQSDFFEAVRIEPGNREGENVLTMRVIDSVATEGT